jgi:hypothetical protein
MPLSVTTVWPSPVPLQERHRRGAGRPYNMWDTSRCARSFSHGCSLHPDRSGRCGRWSASQTGTAPSGGPGCGMCTAVCGAGGLRHVPSAAGGVRTGQDPPYPKRCVPVGSCGAIRSRRQLSHRNCTVCLAWTQCETSARFHPLSVKRPMSAVRGSRHCQGTRNAEPQVCLRCASAGPVGDSPNTKPRCRTAVVPGLTARVASGPRMVSPTGLCVADAAANTCDARGLRGYWQPAVAECRRLLTRHRHAIKNAPLRTSAFVHPQAHRRTGGRHVLLPQAGSLPLGRRHAFCRFCECDG